MDDHTPTVKIRVPPPLWQAYGRCCARTGRSRTADLTARMRQLVYLIGTDIDRDDLAMADAELAIRRARKGGRPRNTERREKEQEAS